MKLQPNDYDCSIASIQNALRVFDIRFGYRRIFKAMRDKEDPKAWTKAFKTEGADEHDIQRALTNLKIGFRVLETNRRHYAEEWLESCAPAWPSLLCVDDWRHWVTIAGVCDGKLLLQDPDRDPENVNELGNHWLKKGTILRRWRASTKRWREGGLYYGIAVLPPV
jgi:hypothetical protein